MKLSIKALTLASALLWGFAVLFVAVANLLWPPYGGAFLEVMSSIYPGYEPAASFVNVVVGTLYAAVDGAIGGVLFAWIYNCVVK